MSEDLYRDRVRERDLDNFLVEELQASTSFRDWFVGSLQSTFDTPAGEVRVRKSPPRSDGRQTDVELGWFDLSGQLEACVLIESKITADFQPGQSEAYRAEVAEYRRKLGPRRACSVLIAPAQKLTSLLGREHFDTSIALEDIAETLRIRIDGEMLSAELAARLSVRTVLLEALCGKRSGSGWTPVTVAEKRDFAAQYAQLASLILPDLTVRPSSDGPKALTRIFDGLNFTTDFPCSVSLRHEFGTGAGFKYANILFAGAGPTAPLFRDRSDLLDPIAASVTEAGKSLAIRIATPSVIPDGAQFEAQRDKVRVGLEAVARLANWFGEHQQSLASILRPHMSEEGGPQRGSAETPVPHGSGGARELEAEMRNLAAAAIRDYGYKPRYFLDMLDRVGPLATAHTLLAGPPSEGFTRLWDLGALHLSVEALLCREPWSSSGLFSDEELLRARRRLSEAGYVGA